MFQMTKQEFEVWRSQFVTSKGDKKGLRRPPYVFTEQGVAMLSAILKSDIAIDVSIKIINAFVAMRKYLSNNIIEQHKNIFFVPRNINELIEILKDTNYE